MDSPASPLIHIFLWKSSGFHVGKLWMVFRTNFLIFSHVDNLQIFQMIQESFQHPYSRPEILLFSGLNRLLHKSTSPTTITTEFYFIYL